MKTLPINSIPKQMKRGCILETCLVHISDGGIKHRGQRNKVMLVEVGFYKWNLMGLDGNRVFDDPTENKQNHLSDRKLLDMLETGESHLQYEVKYIADSLGDYMKQAI